MTQIIYKQAGRYYMTNEQNYTAVIQNARAIHELQGVNTLDDVKQFIDNCCKWYNDTPDHYKVIA